MKDYIYTVWSKPWSECETIFNKVSILLSVEMTKKIGNSVTIYTDTENKKWIQKHIEDVEVNCLLDDFKETNLNKWSLPKMHVLNNITKSVCHIDYDVFLFKEQEDIDCDITTQNIENSKNYSPTYKLVFDEFIKNVNINTVFWELKVMFNEKFYGGYNCGYIDVKNLDLCKKWTNKAIETFKLMKTFNSGFNCILPEQTMLYTISQIEKCKIGTLFDIEDIDDGVSSKENKPFKNGYCHLMSNKFERIGLRRSINVGVFNKLLNRLEKYFNSTFVKFYNNSNDEFKTYLKNYEKQYN